MKAALLSIPFWVLINHFSDTDLRSSGWKNVETVDFEDFLT